MLGRPSVKFRKIQVFAVVSFWSVYLLRGDNHGPPVFRELSKKLSKRLTPYQVLVITMLWLYISRNFAKICGLETPEPLANLYSRAYFRATWVTTALDAGFWTAMRIRKKWLRDLASMMFSLYYLIAAEQADEKVRKVRGSLTVDHLRVSWNKGTTPYLAFISRMLRPKLARYAPRKVRVQRPPESAYTEPVDAWLYYDAPLSTMAHQTKMILDIPGGGFVAMDPRTNDDKLFAWAGRTGLPVLSLDYKKAPEHPYPYALNECYDVYATIMASKGRCLGMSGETTPRIILTGDSAGGNLATSVVLMVLQSRSSPSRTRDGLEQLPVPDGLILMYPGLDMNINSWMTDEQMSLIQDQRSKAANRNVLRKKSMDYYKLDPSTPAPSEHDDNRGYFEPVPRTESDSNAIELTPSSPQNTRQGPPSSISKQQAEVALSKPRIQQTRLAMSSMISYFNDRILTPEMMRAMIILYVGPHTRPDFTTDYLLSPLLAPDMLLAEFPKTYFLTGERDPLVDDTVIFAGRLRQAKYNRFIQRKELGLFNFGNKFNEREHVEVALIPGISHGFLQFVGVFPEGWKHIFRCTRWMEEIFAAESPFASPRATSPDDLKRSRHHNRRPTDSSGDEDRPLEMTTLNGTNGNKRGNGDKSRGRRRAETQRKEVRDRVRSAFSLPSEEDLLKRRMKGLTAPLMMQGDDDPGMKTP